MRSLYWLVRLSLKAGSRAYALEQSNIASTSPRINVTYVLNAPIPICLNASMFARIIRDPSSPTEEVSIRFFYESLQIAFSNNVLVSQFHS